MQSDSLLQKLCSPLLFYRANQMLYGRRKRSVFNNALDFPIVSKAIEKSGHRQNVIDFCLEL